MSKAYNRTEYYDALEAVIVFIKERGLKYITDLDEHEECETSVDWLLESKRGPAFKLSAKYFSTAVESKKEICVAVLKNSDLTSEDYRNAFNAAFMEVVNDLSFIPKPRKAQIKRVVEGKKDLKDEQDCIVLLQDLLYTILPKFFKINSAAIRAMVTAKSTLPPAVTVGDSSGSGDDTP